MSQIVFNEGVAASTPATGKVSIYAKTDGLLYSKDDAGTETPLGVSGGGSGSVTSVGMTVPTGLSIAGSPITTSGTLAITYTSGYSIPTTANQTNWSTAYGWGNHATAGYLDNGDIGSTVLAYDSNLQSFATTFTLPTTDSTSGYVLSTNGSGTLSWIANGSGGSMDYPGAGIAVSTGSAWGTSITDNSSNWNTAYSERAQWDGGATNLNAVTGRTSLGLGSLATQSGTFSGTSSGTNTGDQNVFQTISVSGQSNVVADSTSDTLTLVAGSNITITTNASTDSITIEASGGGSVPVGTIIDFAGTSAPTGFLACPTSATNISRTTYANLFAAIGTTWGTGDGSTTFGMPFFPANYASVQANSNVGTNHVGENLAHTHTITEHQQLGGGGQPQASATGTAPVAFTTSSSGGAANLAAGVRVLKCVKF